MHEDQSNKVKDEASLKLLCSLKPGMVLVATQTADPRLVHRSSRWKAGDVFMYLSHENYKCLLEDDEARWEKIKPFVAPAIVMTVYHDGTNKQLLLGLNQVAEYFAIY